MLLISENELREAIVKLAEDSGEQDDVKEIDEITRTLWSKLTDIVIKRKVDEFVVQA